MFTKAGSLAVSEMVFNCMLNDAEFVENYSGHLDTFNNCRETGFMLTVFDYKGEELSGRIAVWAHQQRNSDSIIVRWGTGADIVHPNNMFSDAVYRSQSKSFAAGEVYTAAAYVTKKVDVLREKLLPASTDNDEGSVMAVDTGCDTADTASETQSAAMAKLGKELLMTAVSEEMYEFYSEMSVADLKSLLDECDEQYINYVPFSLNAGCLSLDMIIRMDAETDGEEFKVEYDFIVHDGEEEIANKYVPHDVNLDVPSIEDEMCGILLQVVEKGGYSFTDVEANKVVLAREEF